MSFAEALKSVFTQYTGFSGRARRKEFWYFALFNAIVVGVLGGINATSDSSVLTSINYIYSIAVLLPSIALSIRRMHDIGKSGWAILISLIPIVGGIIMLIWNCTDSQPGDNQYGPNPKGL